jgi:membrane-associated phospholipid phosphatase
MTNKELLFWQPKKDYFKHFCQFSGGRFILVATNYVIWIFLFYLSYLLIRKDLNIFGQLLFATVLGELIEKYLKTKKIWHRPVHKNKNTIPSGLIKHWYTNGSFPSGHTIKAVFFFLFIIQYQVFNPVLYWAIVLPLLSFRVVVGLHYPIDVLGGAIMGVGLYFLALPIRLPPIVNNLIEKIFNFIFYVR